jgi:flagellar basal-body rod modification protein FlgD
MSEPTDVTRAGYAGLGLNPQASPSTARKELGQEEFFRLMVAQLKSQDPLKPLESNEFLGQVAQFTTVRGIQEMQSSLANLAASLGSAQALQASTLVGREVLVPASAAYLDTEGGVSGLVQLPSSTSNLTVTVRDAGGRVVRESSLGPQAAGEVEFAWDGRTPTGQRAAPGLYSVTATVESGGATLAAETLVSARVDSVTLGRGGAPMELNLAGLGSVGLASVRQIL